MNIDTRIFDSIVAALNRTGKSHLAKEFRKKVAKAKKQSEVYALFEEYKAKAEEKAA